MRVKRRSRCGRSDSVQSYRSDAHIASNTVDHRPGTFSTDSTFAMTRTSKRQRRLPSVAVDFGVRQHGSHERVAASMRRIARPMTTANHSTSNHNAVFVVAANAIPVGEDGAERNGPPKTSHHTVVPGCTNPRRGSLTTDGMISADARNASAATLAIASNVVARSHQRRITLLMHAA